MNLSGGSLSRRMSAYRGIGFSSCSARCVLLIAAVFAFCCSSQKQVVSSKPPETEKNAAQIELLETKYRFETNGDSRKEVHTRVRINNELGVRQFGRLNFDFNRSFQAVEIPMVRITHASGGTADILPSAITDNPNPAVVDAPAYQHVRVKSVRILGLQPGDVLEYRVITTTTHHPLAPDFWLDHSFDRSGIVSEEHFQVLLPASILASSPLIVVENRNVRQQLESRLYVPPGCGLCWEPDDSRPIDPRDIDPSFLRQLPHPKPAERGAKSPKPAEFPRPQSPDKPLPAAEYGKVQLLVKPFASSTSIERSGQGNAADISYTWKHTAASLRKYQESESAGLEDLPDIEIGKTSYWSSLSYRLYVALSLPEQLPEEVTKLSIGPAKRIAALMATPAAFSHLVIIIGNDRWLDPSLEVAPFGVLPAAYRGSTALILGVDSGPAVDLPLDPMIGEIPKDLPLQSSQKVELNASIEGDGKLTAKVKYAMRGDNELLLRIAFHKTPKEKWKDVAQLLAISDGFRGQIINVTASDPYATKEPFAVEYEISQPKFVDWSKKTVRIPALLPLPGLPEAPSASAGTSASSAGKKSIDLGTPLDIALDATVHLPDGATAQAPTGTSVERDYATFLSKYSAQGNTLHATRKLHFLLPEIPTTRAADFNAFLHAVQADQTQLFTLERTQPAEK